MRSSRRITAEPDVAQFPSTHERVVADTGMTAKWWATTPPEPLDERIGLDAATKSTD
jgi:hypothetical protein